MLHLDSETYWNERWLTNETRWDIGAAATPLTSYLAQLKDRRIRILIPGCGNAHEAAYLLAHGFTNITLLDISPYLVAQLEKKLHAYLDQGLQIICGNFFDHVAEYDLILEQTFFCALSPSLRPAYACHVHRLLSPNGKVAGVLFNKNFETNPPFGGSQAEYETLFQPYFDSVDMSPCHNSIDARMGSELFILLHKKKA